MAAIFAVAIVPLLGFVGVATDTARGYLVRAQLSHAIDAAALAGAKVMFEDYRDSDIRQFFEANFPRGYMGAVVDGPHIEDNLAANRLIVTASATVPVSFMSVLGFEEISVSARSVVQRELRGMELVLVMDNTGSMRSGGKMAAMRDAALELIGILYGDETTKEDFFVGLVPYTAMVNIGTAHSAWLTSYTPADYAPTSWKGCVEARAAPLDESDAAPVIATGVNGFAPAFWASTLGEYEDEDGDPLDGDNDWDATHIDERNSAQNNGLGPNLGCGPPITPLTDSRTTIEDAIRAMQPWHRGGTMANLGLAWGWRLLSPGWRGLWQGMANPDLPLEYSDPLMDKVLILLTDGENQWYDWPDGLPGKPDESEYPDADYTAYGRLSEGRLGTTSGGAATNEINARMLRLCTAIKQAGIRIFSITFRVSSTSVQNRYRACASEPANYFNSPSNAELSDAFRQIGAQLSNLRLAE